MHVRFLGHSSFLLEFSTGNVLVDPNFNCHSFGSYKRMIPAPISIAELPPIALILITMEHEDHFDKKSIEQIVARDNSCVVAHDSVLSELPIPMRCKRGVTANAQLHVRGVQIKVHLSHHPQSFYPMSYMVTGDNVSIYTLPLHFKKVLTGSHGGNAEPHIDIPRYVRLVQVGKLELISAARSRT